jgi:hypothetical protein
LGDKLGRIWTTHGGRGLTENLTGRNQMRDLGIDGRITLKLPYKSEYKATPCFKMRKS